MQHYIDTVDITLLYLKIQALPHHYPGTVRQERRPRCLEASRPLWVFPATLPLSPAPSKSPNFHFGNSTPLSALDKS